MNSRSAAREIVILSIPLLPKDNSKIELLDFEKIILSLTRSLSDYAKKNILDVTSNLERANNFLINAEVNHPVNEERTSNLKTILIPDTEVLKDQIEILQSACTELFNAIDLPEIIVHMGQESATSYAKEIFKKYIENKNTVNEIIEQASQMRKSEKKWKVERMVRLERDILRVATTELLFFQDTPLEVICDEAVKIAQKYGGDESKKFVNGVLGDVVVLTRKEQNS